MLAPSKKTGKLKCYYFPSDKAMRAIKSKVKAIVGNNQHKSVKEVAELLNPMLRGWGNYYQDGNARERFTDIGTYV
jgi:RNA-directed DNA polymerase